MWSKKYSRCIICNTDEIKYVGNGMCKRCYDKEYRKKNLKKVKKLNKKWLKDNPEYHKKWRKKNRTKENERTKNWRKANPEKSRESNRNSQKKLREIHPERFKKYDRKKYQKNKEKIKNRVKVYKYKKCQSDSRFKLRQNISCSIHHKLKSRLSSKKGKSTFDFLPYTIDDLIQHLEEQFEPGMTWKNHTLRGWHIDHKIPDCKFNYKTVDDKKFQECWALENLQPLWWQDNLKKGRQISN